MCCALSVGVRTRAATPKSMTIIKPTGDKSRESPSGLLGACHPSVWGMFFSCSTAVLGMDLLCPLKVRSESISAPDLRFVLVESKEIEVWSTTEQ